MRLSFEPYELKLRHTFTVATYSRTTTPDVQVKIEYDGFTGYGEASMPPYLGQTVESVCNFLKKVDLGQFSDPFQIDDILTYVDGINEGDTAAKAAVDIALHDLVGQLMGQPCVAVASPFPLIYIPPLGVALRAVPPWMPTAPRPATRPPITIIIT